MSEMRRDWLADRWVIIAENRAGRPNEFRPVANRQITVPCPFCRGQELETPPPVAVYGADTGAATDRGWQVRVVPNKYPAVRAEGLPGDSSDGLHPVAAAYGIHEVIIESPRHVVSLSGLTDTQIEWTFQAYRDRLEACRRSDRRLGYGLVFKNARADGGASLEHSHSQLLATERVPVEVANEWTGAAKFYRESGACAFCALLERELAMGRRIVAETEHLVAYCPFASRFPYETWIVPRQHAARFEESAHVAELAYLTRRLIEILEAVLPEPAYNYWIHTAPWQGDVEPCYHWHVEVVTRLSRLAGFELGAGYFINPVSPEEAASRLRSIYNSPTR